MQDRGGGEGCANGFDFLVNAVWPEIVATLEEKASIIFAPGNPNTFHRVRPYELMGIVAVVVSLVCEANTCLCLVLNEV